jgi:hypothetical protein
MRVFPKQGKWYSEITVLESFLKGKSYFIGNDRHLRTEFWLRPENSTVASKQQSIQQATESKLANIKREMPR